MVGTSQVQRHEHNLQHKLHHKEIRTLEVTTLEHSVATRGLGVG